MDFKNLIVFSFLNSDEFFRYSKIKGGDNMEWHKGCKPKKPKRPKK